VLRRDAYRAIAENRSYFGDFELPIRYRERTYGTTNIQRWRHGWLLLKMCVFAAGSIKFV
jgi:hypothetical protein